jgi:glycosidase
MKKLIVLLAAGVGACSSSEVPPPAPPPPPPPPDNRLLDVPSPDWRDQVIYFVFTDRFANGDPNNDDQGQGEFDASDFRRYSGGDLQGVIDRLDYIQGMGVTAVWITPPVANQWWDPRAQFGGFHGYWARDLTAVDEHQGTLETYKNLSDALHRRGMYLIQDIVPNHLGNFFSWDGAYDPGNPATNFVLNEASVPTSKPAQAPFSSNDARDPDQRAAAIYHFTPQIVDFTDPLQEKTWAISDLDDLNTENPVVIEALKKAYGYWIDEVGVDGVRIDTVKFVAPEFWPQFLHDSGDVPGLERVARATGREGFLTFGEVFETSQPYGDEGEQKIRAYLGSESAPSLDSALAFPLYDTLKRVLGEGRPTAELADRLQKMVDPTLVPRPYLTPTFLDNHDVQRFLSVASPQALSHGLTLLFTLPGLPVVYQGTEQNFTEPRASMFAAGWGSGGVDHFDTTAPTYLQVKALAALRAAEPALRHGTLRVVRSSPDAGVLAYLREEGSSRLLVILNSAPVRVLVGQLDLDLAPGTVLEPALGSGDEWAADDQGLLLKELDANSIAVYRITERTQTPTPKTIQIQVDSPLEGQTFTGPIGIRGRAVGLANVSMVFDDRISMTIRVPVRPDGTFTTTVALDRYEYGESDHTITFYSRNDGVVSVRSSFRVDRVFDGQTIPVPDVLGDDVGPNGQYRYPTDATFSDQMDVENLTILAGGSTLILRLQMAEITKVWAPANGFDHVSFNLYFDLPGSTGLSVLPKIDATAPGDFAWDYTHFVFGFGQALHSKDGATATEMGMPVPGAPKIKVDAALRQIELTHDGANFGVADWGGVRLYLTTWDFDGLDARYRDLSEAGGQWVMGGAPAGSPKIMDDVGPVLIPPG